MLCSHCSHCSYDGGFQLFAGFSGMAPHTGATWSWVWRPRNFSAIGSTGGSVQMLYGQRCVAWLWRSPACLGPRPYGLREGGVERPAGGLPWYCRAASCVPCGAIGARHGAESLSVNHCQFRDMTLSSSPWMSFPYSCAGVRTVGRGGGLDVSPVDAMVRVISGSMHMVLPRGGICRC